MKKGQAALEQFIITGLGIFFIAILFVIAITFANDHTRITQAQDAVNKLAKSTDYVYALGPGSKYKVNIYVPEGLESVSIEDSTIRMTVTLSSGTTDVFVNTNAELLGSITSFSGPQEIIIYHTTSGKIIFGDNPLACHPVIITKTMSHNEFDTASFSIQNTGEYEITGISASLSGNLGGMLELVQPWERLSPGENDSVGLNFHVDSHQSGGTYTGLVTVSGSNYSECAVSITLYVNSGEDASGPVVFDMNHSPTTIGFSDPITITATATDETTGSNRIYSCELDLDFSSIWNQMLPSDGMFDQVTENITYSLGVLGKGSHTVRARCIDVLGNLGPATTYTFVVGDNLTGIEDITGPIVLDMTHTNYPTTISNISVGGTASDSYTGNSSVSGCNMRLDSGEWIALTAQDGVWNSSVESFSYNFGQLSVGRHDVYYQCTDSWGAVGSIYQDSFTVVDVDLMLVLDRSGSMTSHVTSVINSNIVSTSSTNWASVKTLTVSQKNGDLANLTIETRAGSTGCTVYYNATIDGSTVASGSRTSTSYGTDMYTINVSNYTLPYQVVLYLKRSTSGCTVYNRYFSLTQSPSKMNAVKNSSKSFLDIAGSSIQAGLVSYSTSATTDKTLAVMTPTNQQALKNSIDSLVAVGNTCIECGLTNAANELVSIRARPDATKVVVLLTDGQANVGDSVNGAVYCRNRNVTVYTIGFGYDVDETELLNIALLTHGEYYFAPDTETLTNIFNSLGRSFKGVSE